MGSEDEQRTVTRKRRTIMKIQWIEDFESAMRDAKRERKHVLLDFHNPH
jgi:hypothetical protein